MLDDRGRATTAPASPPRICRTCSSGSTEAIGRATAGLRHRHGPVDRPRAAGRGAGPRVGENCADGGAQFTIVVPAGAGARRPTCHECRRHDAAPASCSSTTRWRSSARWRPLLRSRGYDVRSPAPAPTRSDGRRATPPDLIVLDLGLPDLEGTEVCRRIRAHPQVPIIVLSARGAEADKVERARPRRRRLRHEAVRPRGAAGAHSGGAAPRRVRRRRPRRPGVLSAGDLTIDYDRRRVLAARRRDPADAQGIRTAVAAGAQSRSRADPSRHPEGHLGTERGGAARAPVDAGGAAATRRSSRIPPTPVSPQRTVGRLSVRHRRRAATTADRRHQRPSGTSSGTSWPIFRRTLLSCKWHVRGRSMLTLGMVAARRW